MSISVIVTGVDGSEGSNHALEWVAGLAAQTGARVVAVHTFEPLAHLEDQRPPYDFQLAEESAKGRLEKEWMAPLIGAGVEHECRMLHGAPWECLIDVADETDADLIVVGARGFGVLRGLALGSTSNKLIHASHRPVVVIPPVDRS